MVDATTGQMKTLKRFSTLQPAAPQDPQPGESGCYGAPSLRPCCGGLPMHATVMHGNACDDGGRRLPALRLPRGGSRPHETGSHAL